ncbi:MAG: type II toxin-antitoxin system VapC family toxin [Pseudomonadota bacterium]
MKPEKVFADTNIFLRYLTNDVPDQADAVEELFRSAAIGDILLITNSLVIAEIVWTLESFYKLSREDIQVKVLAILNTPGLEVADSDLILQAIAWYKDKNVDFLDGYNGAWLTSQGIKTAYTFDQKHFSRFEGISVKVPVLLTNRHAPPGA